MEGKTSIKDLVLKVLFIIGIIIIIVILAFSVIRFVPKVFSSFASVASLVSSPFTSEIEVKSNSSELNTNDTFALTWEYKPKEIGDYYFRYDCVEGVSINIISNEGVKGMLCNTQYNLGTSKNANFKVNLNKKNSFVDFPVVIEYASNSGSDVKASGKLTLSVKNEGVVTPNSLSSATITNSEIINTNPTTNPAPQNTNTTYTSKADLSVMNVSSNNNQVSFTVMNVGGQSTGIWYFSYLISGESLVYSNPQMSLRSGEGIRYTLTFDNESDESVTVIVDAARSVNESNESNNSFTTNFDGTGNGNSNSSYDKNDDANLEITSLEVGRMNGNSFREDDEIDDSDEAAVRFIVKNTGGENTGSWRYEITNTPYDNDDDYRSNNQSSLRPGESREIIISFDNIDEGNYSIKVEVDSDDDVDEESERDNTESEKLEVTN